MPTTALLLGIRFSKDRGDVYTRLRHLHDFASSELDRFSSEKAGAVALMALCGVQLGVQIRLGLPGGVLGTAKRVSALIRSVPGLVRCAGCCALQGDDLFRLLFLCGVGDWVSSACAKTRYLNGLLSSARCSCSIFVFQQSCSVVIIAERCTLVALW